MGTWCGPSHVAPGSPSAQSEEQGELCPRMEGASGRAAHGHMASVLLAGGHISPTACSPWGIITPRGIVTVWGISTLQSIFTLGTLSPQETSSLYEALSPHKAL